MKKILITLSAVAMVAVVHAAAANWQCTAANIYDGAGTTAAKWSGTAYIYAYTADTLTQDTLWATFSAGGDIKGSSIATATVANGGITTANSQFSYGEQGGGSYSYFFALVDGDNVLFSKTITATANGTATQKSLAFGSLAPTTGASSKDLPTQGYYAIGAWASVPEPTSGLLMLIGVAGLALRRRRA